MGKNCIAVRRVNQYLEVGGQVMRVSALGDLEIRHLASAPQIELRKSARESPLRGQSSRKTMENIKTGAIQSVGSTKGCLCKIPSMERSKLTVQREFAGRLWNGNRHVVRGPPPRADVVKHGIMEIEALVSELQSVAAQL